jgi:hypothetical protein
MTTATEALLDQVFALPDEEGYEFLTQLQARLRELTDGELGDDALNRRLADVESGKRVDHRVGCRQGTTPRQVLRRVSRTIELHLAANSIET